MRYAGTNRAFPRFRINWDFVCKAFIVLLLIAMLCFFLLRTARIVGELDDSLLPLVSMVNDGTLGVSEADVAQASAWFPAWSSYLQKCMISPHYDLNGERMAYYFPTYPMLAVPVLLAMIVFHLPKEHVFTITNILCICGMLWLVDRHAKIKGFKKLLLLMALSLNPILPYIEWGSMEVLVYCLLVMATFYWVNRRFHIAAVLLSIAGTMNLTVMAIGFFMIADYLIELAGKCPEKKLARKITYLFSKWRRIILYGCCYLIVFIPIVYNYVNIGLFNIVINGVVKRNPSAFSQWFNISSRAWAYLTDLNFGFLPYFLLTMLVLAVMIVYGIHLRKRLPLMMMAGWLTTIFCYSVMTHINCGMDGIARYSAWGAAILIIAVFYLLPQYLPPDKRNIRHVVSVILAVCMLSTMGVTSVYMVASSRSYLSFTPIAKAVLGNYPALYNPLYSTFNSRTRHLDGAYDVITPVVYTDEWTNKILIRADQAEDVIARLIATDAQKDAIRRQVANKPSDAYVYLSFADREKVWYINQPYELGTVLNFASNNGELNGKTYTLDGLSSAGEAYTWTINRQIGLDLFVPDYDGGALHGVIAYADILDDVQQVIVSVNGTPVFSDTANASDGAVLFSIPEECIDLGILRIRISLPDAHSPGVSDPHLLGLALTEIVITK